MNNQIRSACIFHLISSNGVYGAEKVVLALAEGMKAKRYQVIVANIGQKSNKETAIVKEAKTKGMEGIAFSCSSRIDSKTIKDIRAYIVNQKIDIIHSHGYKSNYFALKAVQGTNTKLVATCHNWTSNTLKMKLYEYVDKKILRKFDQVVAVSNQIYQRLTDSKVPGDKLKLIYNGISIQESNSLSGSFKEEYHVPPDTKCIGTIGRLSREKGQIYLIRAFKQLIDKGSNAVLFIIGEGPQKEALQQEANKLNIDNKVIFTGYRADISNILASLDVFVLPSLKEGVPMILLEAMLAKKVIVATEVGEVPKILGKNGLLCPAGDTNSLIDSITKALQMPGNERAKIGANTYNTVINKYSQEKMVNEYDKVYRRLIA